MPELSRFFGIVIRMFMEAGEPHHLPHFHAYYQGKAAVFSLKPVKLIAGYIPHRQRQFVKEWAKLHRAELLTAWDHLQQGDPPFPIEPLE